MPRPTRVLLLISSLHRGGAERQLFELATRMDPVRYEASVALCDPHDEFGLTLPSERVHSFDSPHGATVLTLGRVVSLVRRTRPDIVHGFGGMMNLYPRLAAAITRGVRAISSVRNGLPLTRDLAWDRLTWRLAKRYVANSEGIREVLVTRAKVPREHIEVIVNGVDTDRFAPAVAPPREGLTLALPARRTREKNHLGVIAALARLSAQNALPPGLRVRVVGREAEAAYEREIRAAIVAAGLGAVVSLEPVTDAMTALYHASDAVLLPSLFEGMPNVVLEAMASGLPALVSDAANLDHIVTDGVDGIALGSTRPEAIAEGILRLSRMPPAARAAMGARARETTLARFSLDRMVGATCALYDRLMADGP